MVNLTARKQIYFLKDLEDMHSKNIRLIYKANSGLHRLLKTSPPGTLEHRLWNDNVMPHGETKLGVQSHEEGLNFVAAHPGHAYLFFENIIIRQGLYPCSIIDLPGVSTRRIHLSFALQKDSPLTEMFDFFLRRLIISGVVRKTKSKYYDASPSMSCPGEVESSLSFKALFSIFFLFLLGVALALLAMIIESLLAPFHKDNKRLPHPMDPENYTEDSDDSLSEEKVEPIDIYVLLEIISQQRLKIEECKRLLKIYSYREKIKKNEKAETTF